MPAAKRLTKKNRAEFLAQIRAGMRPGASAEALGLSRDTVLEQIGTDDGLAEDVAKAEAEATEHVEEALYQAAVSGNVSACKMWLDLRKKRGGELVPVSVADEPDFDRELRELNDLAAGR